MRLCKSPARFLILHDHRFGADFFARFDLVINALDNLDARKHVNRMCVKLEKPLVESGTRGYSGQVLACILEPG